LNGFNKFRTICSSSFAVSRPPHRILTSTQAVHTDCKRLYIPSCKQWFPRWNCVHLIVGSVSTTFLSLTPGFPGRKFISGRGTAQTEKLARPWTISCNPTLEVICYQRPCLPRRAVGRYGSPYVSGDLQIKIKILPTSTEFTAS